MESIRAVFFLSIFFFSLWAVIQSISKNNMTAAGNNLIVLIASIVGILLFIR